MEATSPTRKELAQRALEANQRLHHHLSQRANQLEADILQAERLLERLEASGDDELAVHPEDEVYIPGAARPAGLFLPKEYLNEDSPFSSDAKKRNEYAAQIAPHVMNPRELLALGEAVRDENRRLQAIANQTRNNISIDLEMNVEGINWGNVAEKVSDSSANGVTFTPDECRIKWVGYLHPSISHSEWGKEELERLKSIVDASAKPLDWVKVARELGTNRTPLSVMSKSMVPRRHTWDSAADERLRTAVALYGVHNWIPVARHVSPYATSTQCASRWAKTLCPDIKRGAWSPEEDERLRRAVEAWGNSWVRVSEFLPGRTNDQCKERWTEALDSGKALQTGYSNTGASGAPGPSNQSTTEEIVQSRKNVWSDEEDEVLLRLVQEMGNQWKVVSGKIGNDKTGPSCRSRYNKLLKTTQTVPRSQLTSTAADAAASQTPSTPRGPANMHNPSSNLPPPPPPAHMEEVHDGQPPPTPAAPISPPPPPPPCPDMTPRRMTRASTKRLLADGAGHTLEVAIPTPSKRQRKK